MAKKKVELDKKVKGMLLGELKRFVTLMNKYLPNSKDKKELLKKFEDVAALVEKAVG